MPPTPPRTSPHFSLVQGLINRHLNRDQPRMLEVLLGHLEGMVYRCRLDSKWTMEFVSEGCRALTGYSPEDLVLNSRISYEEVTFAEDRGPTRAHIESALAARRTFDVEYRICRMDGEVRWVWERGVGVFSEDGKLEAIQGFIQDITERRGNELALREAEERYRGIVEN